MLSPVAGFTVYATMCLQLRCVGRLSHRDTWTVPWWKVGVIGILFASHNVLRNLGNRGATINGAVVLLMAKFNVPISAVLSMMPPLRRRFNAFQWLGMAVLLAGLAVTIGPTFASSAPRQPGASLTEAGLDIVMLLVSVVPTALAMLFIELQVQHRHPKLNVIVLCKIVILSRFACCPSR